MKIKHLLLSGSLILLAACSQTPDVSKVPDQTTQPVEQETASTGNRQAAAAYTTNAACIDIIREFEGVRLEAYKGLSGAWLIGYGHKAGVYEGMKISQAKAESFLKDDLQMFERDVSRAVKVPVTENEFSAMVCLSYNIGSGNFRSSTVLRKINQGLRTEAADAILMWDKVNKKVNPHQVKRRGLERALFVAP